MTMMKTLMLVLVGLTLVATPGFAKEGHHCVGKDGKEIVITAKGKARAAACEAAGGKWKKVKTEKAK
jgi:hypothetical protein